MKNSTPPDERDSPANPLLGTLLLFGGAGVLLLSIIENTTGLPFNMPRSWYISHSLWDFLALACVVAGASLLRQRRYRADDWKPSRNGVRFERLALYTREGCHLCDHARDTLVKYRRYLPAVEEIDIDGDPQLIEQFHTCVPVVELDGKVRFRGDVDELLLRRLIEGTPPRKETGG